MARSGGGRTAIARLLTVLDRLAAPALLLVGLAYGAMAVMGRMPLPGDAAFYWLNRPGDYVLGLYVYPPVLSQLLEPLRWFDAWQVFTIAWMGLCFASFGYALGAWSLLSLTLIPLDIALGGGNWWGGPAALVLMGNVTMPMVAAMVIGMRRPGAWAVPLLTKMTPGIGLAWFAFRGNWRALATGLGVTGVVLGVSFALNPQAWVNFVTFAVSNTGATANGPAIQGPPLALRLVAALALIAWGARTNRPWVVPIAGAMALLGLYGWGTFASVACGALYWFRPSGEEVAADAVLLRRAAP